MLGKIFLEGEFLWLRDAGRKRELHWWPQRVEEAHPVLYSAFSLSCRLFMVFSLFVALALTCWEKYQDYVGLYSQVELLTDSAASS